jgi:hypothetical protein
MDDLSKKVTPKQPKPTHFLKLDCRLSAPLKTMSIRDTRRRLKLSPPGRKAYFFAIAE